MSGSQEGAASDPGRWRTCEACGHWAPYEDFAYGRCPQCGYGPCPWCKETHDAHWPLSVEVTDCNGRDLTDEQGELYDRLIQHGHCAFNPERKKEWRARMHYWRGAAAVRIGLKHIRPPKHDKLEYAAFWAGFDWRRRRAGAGGLIETHLTK